MGQEQTPDSPFTGIMPVYKYEEDKLLSDFPNAKRMFTSSTIGMHDKKQDDGTITAIDTADVENTLQKSMAQKNAFNSFMIEIVVPGNTAVTAGSVIKFTTLSGGGKDNELLIDPFLSGNYLVTEVRHLAQTTPQGIHTMTLTCAKDSVGVEYIPNDKEVLNKDMILAKGNDFNQFDIEEV